MLDQKSIDNVVKTLEMFIDLIKNFTNNYTVLGENCKFVLIEHLTKTGFDLGFKVNKIVLNSFINDKTCYKSWIITDVGNSSINVKLPFINNNCYPFLEYNINKNKWKKSITTEPYINKNNDNKIDKKQKEISYMVFHSGKVQVSGKNLYSIETSYKIFMDIINECKHSIKLN